MSMPVSSEAIAFSVGMDPDEEIEFVIPCSPWLEDGETIVSYTVTPSAATTAAGISLQDDNLIESSTSIEIWPVVSLAQQTNARYDTRAYYDFDVQFTTNSSPIARKRNLTILIIS